MLAPKSLLYIPDKGFKEDISHTFHPNPPTIHTDFVVEDEFESEEDEWED